MKKKLVYIGIILVIILFLVNIIYYLSTGFTIFSNSQFKNKYYSREIVESTLTYDYETNSVGDSTISKNNMVINMSNINYDKDNNILNMSFDFSRDDNQNLNNIGFVLRIYDSQKTFYNQCIGSMALLDDTDFLRYTKYYSQDLFGKDDYEESDMVSLNTTTSANQFYIVSSEDNSSKSIDLSFDIADSSYLLSGKLTVEFLDIQYQLENDSSYYRLMDPLGEIKYNINF